MFFVHVLRHFGGDFWHFLHDFSKPLASPQVDRSMSLEYFIRPFHREWPNPCRIWLILSPVSGKSQKNKKSIKHPKTEKVANNH